MRTVCIVQARMGNTRLPGKNGAMICGKPQIWHVLNRIKQATTFSEIMMAIPHESNGGIQIEAARSLGVEVLDYRGNPDDVLHRYRLAADIMDAQIVVRIPGDNTFVDPDEIDRIVTHYRESPCAWDVLTTNLDRNVLDNGYPGGLGAEVYDVRYFDMLDHMAREKRHREHPHQWAFENKKVRTIQAPAHVHGPGLDLSVNTEEQLRFTREAYEALYPTNPNFRTRELMQFIGEKNGKRSDR